MKSFSKVAPRRLWFGVLLLLLQLLISRVYAQTAKPVITDQPVNAIAVVGGDFTFEVSVADDTGLGYQWKKNNVAISGANDYYYYKDTATPSDAGIYTVVCTNSFGSTTSSNAVLTIWYPPVVTNFTTSSNVVAAGTNFHFQVRVDSSKLPGGPYNYQWYASGFAVLDDGITSIGAMTADLWLSNLTSDDTGDYSVDIDNAAGLTNRGVSSLYVITPPMIIDQPDSLLLYSGDYGTFSFILDADTTDNASFPVTYQWRKNGANISGATSANYDFGPVGFSDAGDYTCLIKNWAGSITSAVATLTVKQPVTITVDPVGATIGYSSTPFTMSVTATGSTPMYYQWRLNQDPIPGATNTSYSFVPTTTNQSGNYDCVVTNDISSDESLDAQVFVRPEISPPVVGFTLPVNNTRVTNTSVSVSLNASDNTSVTLVRCQNQSAGGAWVNCTSNASNWTATMPLVPGSNYLYAEAYDPSGNVSISTAGNNRNVFYPVPVSFTLLINGAGYVNTDTNWPAPTLKSANSNFMTLEYNRAYTMVGVASNTFRFVSWSGSTNNTFSNFTFTVPSNGVIIATFGETNNPTIAITNPAAGRYTNFGSFLVKGTASDNAQVYAVKWQLNSGTWNTATGTNNWQATVAPLIGTNIFRAYAIDTSSNLSTTNSLTFTNVQVGILTLLTNGQGTVSNSLAGQTLFVSSNYTMNAVANSNGGFAFWDWYSSTNGTSYAVATNNTRLTFTMKSNLTLLVVFKDAQIPVLTVSNSLPSGVLTNPAFTLLGSATDNVAVASIKYQLNSSAWATASGTNSWQAALTLATGTNLLRVYAEDSATNRSVTNILSAVNTLLLPVTVTLSFSNSATLAGFDSVSGATYYLEAKGLPDAAIVWTTLPGSKPGNGGFLILTDTNAPATNRFYRVRATSP